MGKQKNRISTYSSPCDYALPRFVSSETIINQSKKKSAFSNLLRGYDNSYSSYRKNETPIIQKTNKKEQKKKTNQTYEAIRELICLGFYARNNLSSPLLI